MAQRGFPRVLQSAGDEPVFRIDRLITAFGFGDRVAGGFHLAAPLLQGGVVAVFELLGRLQAGLRRRGGQRGQEQGGDRGVDRHTADPQVAGAAAIDELTGAGAVVAGRGFAFAVVEDGQFAAAGSAGDQPLQQGAALPQRAGAGLVGLGADVGADAVLVGQVGVPVDEPLVVVDDADLPLVAGQHLSPCSRCPVLADVSVLAGAPEGVGAAVGGMGQDVVDRVIGRVDPDDPVGGGEVSAGVQRQFEALIAQPQPHGPHRATGGRTARRWRRSRRGRPRRGV